MKAGIDKLLSGLTSEEEEELDSLLAERDPLACLLDPDFKEVTWEYEHSKTDAQIPGTLHPKQMEALQSQAKHRWLFWGNQVGKTTLGAVDVALLALGRHPYLQRWEPPLTIWASALTWELWEKILLPELLTWLPPDRVMDAPLPYKKSTKRDILIRADNGKISRITGKAAEQGSDKYQSARVHAVWLDEEHPEAVWDEMMPRLVRHGGITLATMTPLKGLSWVYQRIYEPWKSGKTEPTKHFVSHAGLDDNPSIGTQEIDALSEELAHNPAQLAARLKGQFVRPTGLVLPFDPEKHLEDISPSTTNTWLQAGCKAFAAIDFGLWRFAFGLAIETPDGGLRLIEEMFSQRESLDRRAKKIARIMQERGIPDDLVIMGDCANPQDIMELNDAFMRAGSRYRVAGVAAENKIVLVGVERLENLLNRGALKIRRGIGDSQTWFLGMKSSQNGKPVMGSRLLWEINNWQYPKSSDGKAQRDNPDDDSADGSDMMAMLRYLVMSWWQKTGQTAEKKPRHPDAHPGYSFKDKRTRSFTEEVERPFEIPRYSVPPWNDDS